MNCLCDLDSDFKLVEETSFPTLAIAFLEKHMRKGTKRSQLSHYTVSLLASLVLRPLDISLKGSKEA